MARNGLVMLLFVAGCAGPAATPEPPDVVLITIDALRADFLSDAGHPNRTTPHLDALARDGVVFSQALTSFPGTSPSMPSLMSGMFPSFEGVDSWTRATRHGFNDLESPGEEERPGLSDNLVMLAEIFKDAGYTTLAFATNANLTEKANFHQGFDEYHQFRKYLRGVRRSREHRLVGNYPPANVVVREVVKRLESGVDRPFFLWIHFMDPHSPYLPPEPFARKFPRAYSDLTDLEINESLYHILYEQQGSHDAAARYPSFEDRGLELEVFRDHLLGLYEGEIRFCDAQLRRLFAALRGLGFWDDSVLMVTADHGEEFFDHGRVVHQRHAGLPEELIRIPLVLKPPTGAFAGRRVGRLVRMVDFAPTVLDYAGLAGAAAAMDGVSLRPLVEGGEMPPLTAYYNTIRYGVVRNERFKYRLTKATGENPAAFEKLFDIVEDPRETRDIKDLRPDVLAELRRQYAVFVEGLRKRRVQDGATSDVAVPTDLDPEELERLEGLGYVTR